MTEFEWNDTLGAYLPKGSVLQSEPPTFPPLHCQAWNLAKSVATFVADGCKLVTAEQYQARLEICDTCEHRQGTGCLECGCWISIKAQGRAFRCPKDRWPTVHGG